MGYLEYQKLMARIEKARKQGREPVRLLKKAQKYNRMRWMGTLGRRVPNADLSFV